MLQPVNLLMAHFNVEHTAQISKDALAAAQQTGQGQEVAQESVRRTQMVQAGIAAAEPKKVKRKEEGERRQGRQGNSFSDRSDFSKGGDFSSEENAEATDVEEIKVKKASKSFDLYA